MLPKPLYELLPYLYILAGSSIIMTLDGASTPVGFLLYFFGAWIWMIRSESRRRNSRQRQSNLHRAYWSPVLYELQPFCYTWVGLLIIDWVDHPLLHISGSLLITIGVTVLLSRHFSRMKQSLDSGGAQPIRSQPAPAFIVGATVPEVKTSPGGLLCNRCTVLNICQGVNLKRSSIREIMRLSQTVSHVHIYELFHQAVERAEGRRISEQELRPILDKLGSYTNLCATWRNQGRHA